MIARRHPEKGASLLLTALCAVVLLATLGLVIDIGRVLIYKNELQTFVDAASMAAAYELDGTPQGIAQANTVGTTGPAGGPALNRWNFGTQTISNVAVEFAETLDGSYNFSGSAQADSRFVRATATVTAPIFFLPILPNISPGLRMSATATAGQGVIATPGTALAPFSPDAIDPTDTQNFGFVPGSQYDIKWAPPGQRSLPGGKCPGDIAAGQDAAGGQADRGYVDLGQGNGDADLYNGIVNNDYRKHGPVLLHVGDTIDIVPGNKNVTPMLSQRIAQDRDPNSSNYSAYGGNGRRILLLPVNDHSVAGQVIGYGSFLLPASTCANNNYACCAEYLGPAVIGANNKASGPPGAAYAVKLFR